MKLPKSINSCSRASDGTFSFFLLGYTICVYSTLGHTGGICNIAPPTVNRLSLWISKFSPILVVPLNCGDWQEVERLEEEFGKGL